jgi:adenylate cyclase
MTETRKLAAVMFTDIVGYTALMSKDERKAMQLLQKNREIQESLAEEHNGELLKEMGDGTLLCFPSALDAVRCALEIQRSAYADPDLKLRIGIHLGDILFREGDALGDGVNVASRIEPLAETGGVCISEQVLQAVRSQPEIEARFIGEKTLKNVGHPLRVYSVTHRDQSTESPDSSSSEELNPGRRSIAVLPFTNMSDDKKQEYFCDGIAEDILNDLTQVKGLHVVARTSSFAFNGKNQDIREIGRRLGAHTIVGGSVRKAGNRLRISAQLIDVADGYHLWSERYDRELADVFAIQEEIATSIVRALEIRLSKREKRVLGKAKTQDVQAYDFYLRGREQFHRGGRKRTQYASEMFGQAIKQDKNYAFAYAGLADCYSYLFIYFEKTQENLDGALAASERAIELGPELAEAHAARGLAVSLDLQYAEAESEFEMAIELNPKLYEAYDFYARACRMQGKMQEAALLFEKAGEVRPEAYQPAVFLAAAYKDLKLFTEASAATARAVELAEKHLQLNPGDARALYLGSGCLMALGDTEKAKDWADRALAIDPNEPSVLYNVACTYSLAGEIDRALDYFEKAIEAGFASREWLDADSDFDPIRDHPRFQKAIEKLK